MKLLTILRKNAGYVLFRCKLPIKYRLLYIIDLMKLAKHRGKCKWLKQKTIKSGIEKRKNFHVPERSIIRRVKNRLLDGPDIMR